MRKLRIENINTPEYFDKAYFKRQERTDSDFNTYDKERFELLTKHFKGGKLLDLGCGDSSICVDVKDAEVHGLDFAEKVIEHLQKKYPKVHYVCGDVLRTPYKDEYFDYVVAGELIEHMEYPANLIQEAMRILKPGGILALSTPLEEAFTAKDFISPEHIWSFKKEDIENLCKPYGKTELIIFRGENHPKIITWTRKWKRNT